MKTNTQLLTLLFVSAYFISALFIRLLLGHFDSNFAIGITEYTPAFWFTAYGLTFKMMINILFSFILLKTGLLFFQVNAKSKDLFEIIILTSNIFLIQLWCEFIFVKTAPYFHINRQYLKFIFLSINQYLQWVNGRQITHFEYAFDTINLFEVSFWITLMIGLSKEMSLSALKSVKIVALFYILPLLFLISVITIVNLIFSR
jgi:hypothetical protein